jgi:hypothetical protein
VSDGIGGAIEEELHRVKKGASMKIKGKREVQSEGKAKCCSLGFGFIGFGYGGFVWVSFL